ncbi:hypothetical protein [Chitinophaga sp. S165]|uniref:hypothetical protein n=1 Tax=Chitinophaga sp. S165 TaxID=2135462 RepID=UPI000D70D06A|nr:hypothetical protein [Chitinophaga sp. S165]PWV47051.1 hypothetical protein C7475_109139 [Chitinophaga sp. S165]
MTAAYRNVLDRFANGELTLDKPIYDYSANRQLHELYDTFYIAMDGHLQDRAQMLGWPPPVLLFVERPTVNAFASPGRNPKMIGINCGLVETMFTLFDGQQQVFDLPEFAEIGQVLASTGNEPSISILQFVLSFCYQHEYAHLLQLSPAVPFTVEERQGLPTPPASVPVRHALEMDADHVAAHRVGWLLTGHFKDEHDNWQNGTSEQVTDLTAAAQAGIFCLMVHFAKKFPVIYYGELDHPHPLVRIAFIARYLPKIIRANVPDGIVLDDRAALTKAFRLAERLLLPTYGDPVKNLATIFAANEADIQAYGNQIIDLARSMPGLSHHRDPAHF